MKWINVILKTGLWLQPLALAALIKIIRQLPQGGRVPRLLLFLFSFLPSVYVWTENMRREAAGKTEFDLEDIFHGRPTEYSSSLKQKAMYPVIEEAFLYDRPEGVVFGRIETVTFSKRLRYLCKPMEPGRYEDGHVLIVGGSGSGKSSAVIIPTLLSTSGIGMFCIDIKGELWRKSRSMDEEQVVIIDFQDRSRYGWDALAVLNQKETVREQEIKECMEAIADSLIPVSAKDTSEFWKQSARSLLTGELIGLYKQRHLCNLSELINLILASDAKKLIKELSEGAREGAAEKKYLSSFLELADETFSGVVQQQEEALKVFIDEDIRYAFETNRKKACPQMLEDGKELFLSIREEKLEAYYHVVNLILSQVFAELAKRPEGSAPVLVVIDEFARLCSRGAIPYLHNGILLTGRSRNVTLMLVTQSYEAMENAYSKADIQSIVANCAYLVCLDVRSQETAKSLCSMAGEYMEKVTTWSGNGKNRSVSVSYQPKPVLIPSDLAKLVQKNEVVILSARYLYSRAGKCSYFDDAILAPLSTGVQRYNAVAMGVEADVTHTIGAADTEGQSPDIGELLKRYLTEGIVLVRQETEKWKEILKDKGERRNGKRNDKRDTGRNGKKTGKRL